MQYALKDMIRVAKEAGFGPTPRMVHDWVSEGLLDRPERRGLGRGKGIGATWPEEQRRLFETLLDHRKRVGRVAPLCNIPVWTWLYFGDTYVPLRQVRRALGTWVGLTDHISWKTARRTAQQLLDQSRSQVQMRTLIDEVARMLLRLPRKFNEEDEGELLRLLKDILDPKRTAGLVRNLGGMEFKPETYVEIMKVRLRASGALATNQIDDALFHWARYTNIVSRQQYQWHLTRMTGGTTSGVANVSSLQEMVLRACLDLVTLLGLGLGMPDDVVTQSFDQPATWKARNLRSIVHGEQIGDQIRVRAEVREDEQANELADQ